MSSRKDLDMDSSSFLRISLRKHSRSITLRSGNCLRALRLLSVDSPSGDMKAVLRESSIKGEDKQFLEVRLLRLLTCDATTHDAFTAHYMIQILNRLKFEYLKFKAFKKY